MKRVIVIGLDGLEPRIAEGMRQSGELPHLSRLAGQGGYSRLKTTYPAQTPVAWSTFSTGVNPGGHGIFDFLGRDPKTYLPFLALSKYEQKNAFVAPRVVNNRHGTPIWQLLTLAGIASTVIRCPCTFPPEEIKGRILAGVGVPDLRGGLGTSTFFTTRLGVKAEASEKVIPIQVNNNQARVKLIGPRHPRQNADLLFDLELQLDLPNRKVIVRSEGQPEILSVTEGEWSDWLRVKFKSGMLQSVRGMLRIYLKQITPEFELYVSPINFDPEAPLFPISSPAEYASEILNRLGPYYTAGMAEDHDGLIYGRFDEGAFLTQCDLVLRERRRMMLAELNRFKEGFFFCLFDTPDRLQHMFWRFREPDHPANQDGYKPEFSRVIEEHYRNLDKIVGEAMQHIDDQTLFIVLSDHGMNSFRRGLNLNTWLYENGFLAFKAGSKPGEDGNGEFFKNVDWSKSRAYALALGGIYINQKGREANGIVTDQDVDKLKTDLVKGLSGLIDQDKGAQAIRSVMTREQLYRGPYVHEAPDLLVNFSPGYRVSWGTPLGGTPEGIFEDNPKRWGGDHVIDPDLVPGVLFVNRPFQNPEPSLIDLAPTILRALDVPKHPTMEGTSLTS